MIVFLLSKKELVGKGLGIGGSLTVLKQLVLARNLWFLKRIKEPVKDHALNHRFFAGCFMKHVGSLKNLPNPEIWRVLEISVKSGKDKVSSPSLVPKP
jgi:hypothetical protein